MSDFSFLTHHFLQSFMVSFNDFSADIDVFEKNSIDFYLKICYILALTFKIGGNNEKKKVSDLHVRVCC